MLENTKKTTCSKPRRLKEKHQQFGKKRFTEKGGNGRLKKEKWVTTRSKPVTKRSRKVLGGGGGGGCFEVEGSHAEKRSKRGEPTILRKGGKVTRKKKGETQLFFN